MNEKNLRSNLIELLQGGSAHASIDDALSGIRVENRHRLAGPITKSIWEELEHLRIAQRDIIEYTLSPDWESPSWPNEYWPDPIDSLDETTWNKTHNDFFADLKRIKDFVNNGEIVLTSEIPWGEGRTYLRQVLLVADHNAYHLSKIITIRKILQNW